MKCLCAQTRPRFILSSERVFLGMEFEPMLTPRKKSLHPENFPSGGSNPRRYGQRAQTLPTSYFGPIFFFSFIMTCCCEVFHALHHRKYLSCITIRGFWARMVYLDYIICLRYTILIQNARNASDMVFSLLSIIPYVPIINKHRTKQHKQK